MIRLDFVLPEWTRIIWNSNGAKQVWEPRITKLSNAFLAIEKNCVLQGIKPSWLSSMSVTEYEQTVCSLQNTKYVVHILGKIPISNSYTSSSQVHIEGQPYNYRCVLTHEDLLEDWKKSWGDNDNLSIGRLLGFPDCCQKFFQKYWVDQKFLDTSWPMSLNGTHGPKECNILLRWLGVRAVSHLPCSFDCKGTYSIARKNIDWACANGFSQEMEWLEEMLDWPIQWSALHGIAEIRTPILKISARTDATADLVVVDRPGFSYPKEGSSGTKFPYINKAKSIITKNSSFKRSILLEKQWLDNGFSTFEAMTHSHQILLECLNSLDKNQHYNIIDFGCGNAELLKSIQQTKLKNSTIHGVELDSDRFSRIKYNVDNLNIGKFYNKNMFDFSSKWADDHYDLMILMPGRLTECEQTTRVKFLTWAKVHSKQILWYGYGDWVNKNMIEPWSTMNSMNIEFDKQNSASSPSCFAHLGSLTQKKLSNIFQIMGQ